MELNDYFISQCKAIAILLKTAPPSFKTITNGKKNSSAEGKIGVLDFNNFKLEIMFFENSRAAYAQQTLWLNFTLNSDPTYPFSIYDILSVTQPKNFNCYTYTYVDSTALMGDCFGEITSLLLEIVPIFDRMLDDGTIKNKLIAEQKACINTYFGDSVLESGEMLGASADRLINMMIRNFFEYQIEAASAGGQALFYQGKTEKALKKLKKSKYKPSYCKNLIAHIENGGKPETPGVAFREASVTKGAARHGGGLKGGLKLVLFSLVFDIPVSIILFVLLFIMCAIAFSDKLFITGLWENTILIPGFGMPVSTALAVHFIRRKQNKSKNKDKKAVHPAKMSKASKTMLKYVTIFAETLTLIGLLTCFNSTSVFYENSFRYSTEDFPLSQAELKYSAVDYFAFVEGYENSDKEFVEEPYIVVVTKSGKNIDLYNSTYFSAEAFRKESADFFKDKGIEFKTVKTEDELKK